MIRQLDNVDDVQVWEVDMNVNGNRRYVIHFSNIPFREKLDNETHSAYIEAHRAHAREKLYVKYYRAKWFGGGIVFQAAEGHQHRIRNAIKES